MFTLNVVRALNDQTSFVFSVRQRLSAARLLAVGRQNKVEVQANLW